MKKILVVDDNKKNRKLLRVILVNSGYEVYEAENGKEGLEAVQRIFPDLVLMDYRMPVLDGIEATKEIKSRSATAGIPVFIVTSSAMSGDRQRICSESSCDGFFTKPINYQLILEKIKETIGS